MEAKSRTLAEHIEEIAVRTGAAPDFVEKIGFIFSSKGIPLSENAGPWAALVEETFLLDETLRMTERRTLESLERASQDLDSARSYLRRQIEELCGVEATMDAVLGRPRSVDVDGGDGPTLLDAAGKGCVYIFPGPRRSH